MNLIFKSPNDFKIKDGKLISNLKFEVSKQGNDLIILGDETQNNIINVNGFSGNSIGILNGTSSIGVCGDFKNISIAQKQISFNGYSFTFKNGELYINGDKFINNENSDSNDKNEELKENEFLEYPLEKTSIMSISVSSSAELIIEDMSVLSEEDFSINIQGSGSVKTSKNGYFIKNLNFRVQGSGDIKIKRFQSNNCNCSVQGSGDIFLSNSDFNTLNLNVMGSGDITGKNTTTKNISKNIMGSGDINGF